MNTKYLSILSVLALISCAANEPLPGSESVLLSGNPAPEYCKFLGEVLGGQGSMLTGELTSNSNIVRGARNELRNEAHLLGANYVEIQGQTSSHSDEGIMYNSTIVGNAYVCP